MRTLSGEITDPLTRSNACTLLAGCPERLRPIVNLLVRAWIRASDPQPRLIARNSFLPETKQLSLEALGTHAQRVFHDDASMSLHFLSLTQIMSFRSPLRSLRAIRPAPGSPGSSNDGSSSRRTLNSHRSTRPARCPRWRTCTKVDTARRTRTSKFRIPWHFSRVISYARPRFLDLVYVP